MVTIDGFIVDCLEAVEPSHTSEATQFPIEDGADASDHVIQRPTVVTLEAIVSDTPIGEVEEARQGTTTAAASTSTKPSADIYEFLKEMQVEGRRVTLITEVYPPFKSCVLISLSARKDESTGDSIPFRVQFQVLDFVSVNLESRDTLVSRPRAKKKKKKGNKTPTPVAAEQDTKSKGAYRSTASGLLQRGAQWVSGR